MKASVLKVLQCPYCYSDMYLSGANEPSEGEMEIRSGQIICKGKEPHVFTIEDGIIHFATDFDHEMVKCEVEYSESTFKGDHRLIEPSHVAQYPDTLSLIWPHISHFGPDFRYAMKNANFSPDLWTLDIGTGTCWSSRLLAQQAGNVIAMDVVETKFNGLRTADIHFQAHNVYFERILESMTLLPFKASSIDQIIFNASFHHTPDEMKTLRECYRVLTPTGVVIMLHEVSPILNHLFHKKDSNKSVEEGSSHHDISFRELECMAKQVGFAVEVRVAAHVREKLQKKLFAFGGFVADCLDHAPFLLKQLNTSFLMLRKPSNE